MFKFVCLFVVCAVVSPLSLFGEENLSKIEYEKYHEKALEAIKLYKDNSLTVNEFLKVREKQDVVVLDVRSKVMFDRQHVDGALHLGAGNFTQKQLASLVPSKSSKVLIYCDNSLSSGLTRRISLTDLTFAQIYQLGYENIFYLQDGVSSGAENLKKIPMVANVQENI